MTQRGWPIVGLICAVGLSFAHEPAPSQFKGRKIYETACASCHGLNGKGGERATDIAEIVHLSDRQILKILRDGKPQSGMPAFGGLGRAKLADLLSYVRLLQGKRSQPVATGDVGDGKEFFTGKGGCAQCHTVRGVGGFLGPDLSSYGEGHSSDDIRSAILSADKRPGSRKALAKATTRDGDEISGLVRNEDNFSIQLQALDGTFHLLDKSKLATIMFEPEPVMPSDYDSKLSKEELNQLVAYLVSVANTKQRGQDAGPAEAH
jgi:cytochrome c oxidase cbb3-type subunit III